MRRFFALLLLFLPLSGCITSGTPLFEGVTPSTPLPASFIMHGEQNGESQAWRLGLSGNAYRWEQEKGVSLVRFYPLKAKIIRPGFYVAMVTEEDGGDLLYGLVEIGKQELRTYVFDAAARAAAVGAKVEDRKFSTSFLDRDGLVKTFVSVALKMPAGAEGKIDDGLGEVQAARLDIYDLSDPARAAQGEKLLAEARAQR